MNGTESAGRTARVDAAALTPYVSELALDWQARQFGLQTATLAGTLVFADISGFTRLTERLATRGRYGAEEISNHLDDVLSALLEQAYRYGGWLVKWGGDALLLMFEGSDSPKRASAGAAAMRATMARVGLLDTSVGKVRLRMSVGIHTGSFDFALLGSVHRELLITGADATTTALLEATAEAGEILISPQTAQQLPAGCRGEPKGDGILLARTPKCDVTGSPKSPRGDAAGLIPELVFAHLSAGGGSGEHRPVAVAFLEFSGIAALPGEPDAAVAALAHVVDVTQQACRRYGVSFHETDISADGGKVMLVAGAPHSLDDPAEAMLCMLREVLDDPGPLSLRAGVTTGRVFSGCVGPAFRRSYSVKGDVVNLAARVMGKTAPGEIWAGAEVTDASRTKFQLRPVPPFSVKGKADQVVVAAVGRVVTREDTTVELPLIGRSAELDLIDAALDSARRGVGSCVEIVSDSGMGKSRLLVEARQRAADMVVVAAAGEPFRSGSAYSVVRGMLLDAMCLAEVERGELRRAVGAWCARHASDLAPWLPLLGPVLHADIPDTPTTADLAPEFRHARVLELIADLFTAALPGPSLLVVDDVQFADAASTAALSRLAQRAAEQPWTILAAERTSTDGQRLAAGSRTVALPPLDEQTALVLVHADTDDCPLSPHVAAAVVARGAGNPFFLRQLCRAAGDTDAAELPDSVETIVGVQIGRLDPASREVLRAAAVIGMSVDRVVLGRLLDGEVSGDQIGAVADELGDYVDVTREELRFRQAIIRDAAYESLPYRRRETLHRRVAQLLDERASAVDASAAVRSLHHFRAANYGPAFELSSRAADQAAAAYANVEAAELYRRAFESAKQLPAISREQRAETMERLADVEVLLGEYDRSDTSYAVARRLRQGEPLRAAQIGMKTARSASQRGDYDLTLRRLERVRRVLSGISGPEVERLRLEIRMRAAFTQFRQGLLPAARNSCLDVLARADEAEVPEVVADALGLLDVVEMSLGHTIDSDRSKRALRLYDRLRGLSGQARMWNQIGYCSYLNGRWDDAVEAYRQSQQLSQRLGNLPNAAVEDANIAEILLDQGHLEAAETALRRALRIWRAAGAANDTAFGLALLGRILARQSRFDAAAALLAEARAVFTAQGALAEIIDVDTYLAECLHLAGRDAEALAEAEAALAAALHLTEQPTQAPLLYRVIGGCHYALGHPALGDAAFAESLAVARRRRADHEVSFTVAAMAAKARETGARVDPELIREAIPIQRRIGVAGDLVESEA